MNGIFANDRNWIAAGTIAAVLMPLLVFGIGVPPAVGIGVGIIAFIGVVYFFTPRRLFEGIDISKVARGRLDVARKVLVEAGPGVERLRGAARQIGNAAIAARVGRLAETAGTIVAGVEADPNRLASVQRFLTYYLPRAAELSESYAVLEQKRSPDPARMAQVEDLIGKLDEAFSHYSDTLLESDLGGLDVELRLLQSALKEDMGQRA